MTVQNKKILQNMHQQYIISTDYKAVVKDKQMLLCCLTNAVIQGIGYKNSPVYATSRMLKHLYDKRPAEEYDVLIDIIHKIVKFPNIIFENQLGKRGDKIFLKIYKGKKYLCIVEKGVDDNNYIATAFRVRDENYTKKYKELWRWRDDVPSS
jgi:hypothetical protein